MNHIGEYQTDTFPDSRIGTIDIGATSRKKHHIYALLELDVTEARKLIAIRKKEKKNISFKFLVTKMYQPGS